MRTLAFWGFFLLAIGSFLHWLILSPARGQATTLVITQGESLKTIAANLKKAGTIRSEWLFILSARVWGLQSKFQPGVYTLSGRVSLGELLKILTAGQKPAERIIKIIEGWDIFAVGDYLEREGLVSKVDWFKEVGMLSAAPAKNWRLEFSWLAELPPGVSLEGFLFPDTYRLYAAARAPDIVRRLLQNFESRITPEIIKAMKARKRSLFELVTMASIVESEVQLPADRRQVADIFWRRLTAGMPLEADSTVNYATGKNDPSVALADLKVDSPYNTYRYRGLPKGPISNPGSASLFAAAFPEPNDFWYFLTAPDGRVMYARTFEEHVRNKAKYLK